MIQGTIDSTDLEKQIIIIINDHNKHINLLSSQHIEDLRKIIKLENKITILEKWKNEQLLKQRNQY